MQGNGGWSTRDEGGARSRAGEHGTKGKRTWEGGKGGCVCGEVGVEQGEVLDTMPMHCKLTRQARVWSAAK